MGYQIQNETLAEIRRRIKTKLMERLEAATQAGQPLEKVNHIIYGQRSSIGNINPPLIWIVPAPHTPQQRGGHTAYHDFTFDIVAMVRSYEPDVGSEEAQDLAAIVYDVVMADRTLDGNVMDIIPMMVNPAYSAGNQTQIYWAATQFAFRVGRRE